VDYKTADKFPDILFIKRRYMPAGTAFPLTAYDQV